MSRTAAAPQLVSRFVKGDVEGCDGTRGGRSHAYIAQHRALGPAFEQVLNHPRLKLYTPRL
jgi:hypothetical protein